MDILDAGIVHASMTACLRIESAFENGTEDGWRDAAPVEPGTGTFEQEV